jgi:hypothetical protein
VPFALCSVFEAPTFVAGLDDLAVMCEPVEECGGHLGIPEDARPFTECQIGCDEDRGSFVELADEMEQELAAGLGEGQIAQFIEDEEVEAGDEVRGSSCAPLSALSCVASMWVRGRAALSTKRPLHEGLILHDAMI